MLWDHKHNTMYSYSIIKQLQQAPWSCNGHHHDKVTIKDLAMDSKHYQYPCQQAGPTTAYPPHPLMVHIRWSPLQGPSMHLLSVINMMC